MTTNRGWALVCLLAVGCGDRPVAKSVEPEKAREALKTTLDAWKAGRPIKSLQSDTPPIVAQDFDWMAGAKLDAYEVLGEGTPMDANLKVPVKLTLKGQQPKTVNYVVGTDIRLTVFRAME
ncbi:MAG TPA: hypothetical protein VGJ05_09490 [Fimbriiglobus sp.]